VAFARCGISWGVIQGIVDLSHFNAEPDFAAAKDAGVVAVIHKATQGIAFVDPMYATRSAAARAAGLLWGAYHFATGDDPVAQADFFLEKVSAAVLVLDFELNPEGASMTVAQAQIFVERIHAMTGRWPGIYGSDYLRESAGSFAGCWLWIADYSVKVSIPEGWNTWTLWQFTSTATIAGIGPCDESRFNGTAAGLREFWNGG
jgi:lysozyme